MYHHSVTRFIHNSVLVCLFCICVCVKQGESMMCQGQETYGRRQSVAVSRVQPGHVSAVIEDIFYTWTLNTSLSDVLSVGVRLFQCVYVCAYCLFACVYGQTEMNIKDDFCRSQTDVFLSERGGIICQLG